MWQHPFSTLEHSMVVHAVFLERAYEAVLTVVILILAVALLTGWGLNPLFPTEIPPITYTGEINGHLCGSGEIPTPFGR